MHQAAFITRFFLGMCRHDAKAWRKIIAGPGGLYRTLERFLRLRKPSEIVYVGRRSQCADVNFLAQRNVRELDLLDRFSAAIN